jgi:putative ABC transport system permease protein
MTGAIDIPIWRLGIAYLYFFLVFFLSWWKKLELGRDLFYSIFRMTFQLILMGFLLTYIFRIKLWYLITLIFIVMIFFATQTIIKRSGIAYKGIYRLLFVSILFGGGTVLFFFILAVVGSQPWYEPRYFIPLAGMIIGNSMNGSALALERFYDDVKTRRKEIETWISFGATAEEAAKDSFRKAYRSSLLPTLTNMTGMGIVFLPGMMTGQILGGSSPITAIKYQIAIMAAILGSVALTGYIILTLEYRSFFNKYHLPDEEIFERSA